MYIKVLVHTEKKKYELRKKADDAFEIFIKDKPERGMANSAVRQILAEYFDLPIGKIKLIKGATQPHKIFEIVI